jgi:hypothetical protein
MYKVEKNVPLPNRSRFAFMLEMKEGDSFVVSDAHEKTGATNFARRYNITITTRKIDDGFRIWRV